MELVFVCPQTRAAFRSEKYTIVENHGVRTDTSGKKFLAARVALTDACPFCGEKHVYPAQELACPFGS